MNLFCNYRAIDTGGSHVLPPQGKMDCLGISRPVVPVSSIPSMKQGACGQYGRLVNMSNVQQASKSCSDDQYTTQHAAVGTVVMSKAASSCSLTPATSPPCSLKKVRTPWKSIEFCFFCVNELFCICCRMKLLLYTVLSCWLNYCPAQVLDSHTYCGSWNANLR